MSTKRMLSDAGEADVLERAVLESGLDDGPPLGAELRVWRGVSAALALPTVASAAAAAPAASAASGTTAGGSLAASGASVSALSMLGKGFALGVGVSLIVAGGARVLGEPHLVPTPAPRAPSSAGAPLRLGRAPVEPVNPLPELPAPPAPVPSSEDVISSKKATPPREARESVEHAVPQAVESRTPAASTGSVAAFPLPAEETSASSRLLDEASLLKRARAEMRAGKLAEAFATLEASREKFSAPELSQERESLLIELLYRSGQHASAAERARRFLARFPNSPHATKVRSFVTP